MWCWRRSVGWIVCGMRKYNIELRVEEERNILHTIFKGARLIGLVTSCVGTAF
jgi:hypothetical protein